MKKILITGSNSFVGTSFQKYIEQWPQKYQVDVIGTKNEEWKELDFGKYDCVYHVAGIAHSDTGCISEKEKNLYYKINTDLTIEIATKAKKEGIKQFIFMSSAIVYGDPAPIGQLKVITKNTPCSPANFYGDSKVNAERGIQMLADENFSVVIIRCPMIYGKGGKGNFIKLEKIALKFPLFPKISNSRSMIYIDNLVEFIRLMVENEENGIFWPQNREWTNTSEIVRMIAAAHTKKIYLVPGLTWELKIIGCITKIVNKAFGNLTYDQSISEYKNEYRRYSLEESIKEIER